MARRPEDEPRPNREKGNIRWVNPVELMRDNPAAQIVNKESYGNMLGNFTTGDNGQFEPPQVVRVMTYSSTHGQVERLFVLDGLTRTKFVAEHLEDIILPKYPNFQFTVRDVTEAVLNNPAIIPAEERRPGQAALTMLQYLRAVVPPTIIHSQIAPDRMAAHLINGWENMVGEDLAKKYSALAALSLLANPGINIATNEGLRKDLAKQPRLMAGETIDDRVRLQDALLEMAAVIMQTKIPRSEVSRAAYIHVGSESPVIGGEREARKQVYGLLYTPELERKLAEAFSNTGEREQARDEVGLVVLEAFRRVAKDPNRERIIDVFGLAIRDANLGFNYMLDILTSKASIRRYDEIREEINKDRLTQTYMSTHRVTVLTKAETQLIDRLGSKTMLHEADLPGLTRTVKVAAATLQRAEGLKEQLDEQRDQLVNLGVSTSLLDEAVLQVNSAQEAVKVVDSLQDLTGKTQKLVDTMAEINRRIAEQTTKHQIGTIVDQLTGERLKEGYGPQVRADIVRLVAGEFRNLTNQNADQVRQRVRELSSLDHDLLLQIKTANISLVRALQLQRDRNKPAEAKPAPVRPITPTARPASLGGTPPSPNVEPRVAATPVRSAEDEVIDRQRLEERRRQTNREKLSSWLKNVTEGFRTIDLSHQELTDKEKRELNEFMDRMGRLAFNRPNTSEIMTDRYPKSLEDVRRLREALAHMGLGIDEQDNITR